VETEQQDQGVSVVRCRLFLSVGLALPVSPYITVYFMHARGFLLENKGIWGSFAISMLEMR